MKVLFAAGEVFDGPWTNDPDILDSQLAYRRLHSDNVKYEKGTGYRITSGSFPPHRESLSVSVTLEKVAAELGIDGKQLALEEHENTHGLAAVQVYIVRQIGFMVRLVPTNDNPAHALLFARDTETGECPSKKRGKSLGRKLAKQAELLIIPPGVNRPSK